MDSSFETQISDDNDAKSDSSVVTNTTINTLDGRSPVLFPSLHKYKKERDQQFSTEVLCSPVIPVLDASFLLKSIKQASQSSNEADEDSDDSYVSESLISTQTQKTNEGDKRKKSLISNSKFEEGEVIKDAPGQNYARETTQRVGTDENLMHSSPKQQKLNYHPNSYDEGSLNLSLISDETKTVNPRISDEMVDSQETYMPDVETPLECQDTEKQQEKSEEIIGGSDNQKVLVQTINKSSVDDYEIVAITNTLINNEKLTMLDENNWRKEKELYVPKLSCKYHEMKDDVCNSRDILSKNNLLDEKGKSQSNSMTGQSSESTLPQKLKHLADLNIRNQQQLSHLNVDRILASDETNFIVGSDNYWLQNDETDGLDIYNEKDMKSESQTIKNNAIRASYFEHRSSKKELSNCSLEKQECNNALAFKTDFSTQKMKSNNKENNNCSIGVQGMSSCDFVDFEETQFPSSSKINVNSEVIHPLGQQDRGETTTVLNQDQKEGVIVPLSITSVDNFQDKGDLTVLQPSSGEKPVSDNQIEMERGLVSSQDKLLEGSMLNDDGLLNFSQDTIPPTGDTVATSSSTHISLSGNSESNGKRKEDNMQISDMFNGSQNLFPDTQSSFTSFYRGNQLASVNTQSNDLKCLSGQSVKLSTDSNESSKIKNSQKLPNKSNMFLAMPENYDLSDTEGRPLTQLSNRLTDHSDQPREAQDINISPDKHCIQSINDTVSNEFDAPVTQLPESMLNYKSSIASDKLVTPEEMTSSFLSKTSSAKTQDDDMEISSDVEPSQMILMSTQQNKQSGRYMYIDKKIRSDSQPSSQSQSSSSLSSLGDISEDGLNFKKKEQHILMKIEKMQNKIQKKLTAATKKNSALDIDITKQQIQAIKGILIKIAERHKIERNKLSLEVKKSSKAKPERTQIRDSLMELSERQKSLYKLFQKQKEISSIIRNDLRLNECLASALVHDENNSEKTSSVPKRSATKSSTESKKTSQKKTSKKYEASDDTMSSIAKPSTPASDNLQAFNRNSKRITNTDFSQADCSTDLDTVMPSARKIGGSSPKCNTNVNVNSVSLKKKTFETDIDKNYSISFNGTQELYCDSEEETQITSDSNLLQSRNGLKHSERIQEREITPGDKILTNVNIENNYNGTACRLGARNEEVMLKAMGLFTSTKPEIIEICDDQTDYGQYKGRKGNIHTDITKEINVSKAEDVWSAQKKGRIDSSVKTSGHVKHIKDDAIQKNTQSRAVRSSNNTEESKKSIKLPTKDSVPEQVIYISPASASVVMSQPFKSASKSLLPSNVPLVTQKAKATYLSVPESCTQAGTSSKTNDKAALTRKISAEHVKAFDESLRVTESHCLPKNSVGKKSEQKNTGKLSSSQEKQKRKPVSPGLPQKIGKTKIGPGEQKGLNTQDEMMKKVMVDAMRIINDRSVGNLKRPLVGIEHDWKSKQPRLYMAEPWKQTTTSIYKSPPFQYTETARDISPSVASFTTFRSAFPERSPEGNCPQIQYLTEDIGPSPDGIFNGLKYPPLDMLIGRQILKPGRNILSIHARNKEFKAALTDDGFIESKGGELFQTPVRWLAAVLGKPVPDVKKNRAYREVYYSGRPLMAYVEDPTLVPDKDEIAGDLTPEQCDRNDDKQVNHSSQHSLQKLKDLLNNCTIKLLEDKDLVSDIDLPENFWTEDFSKVKLSYDLWKDVDKWD